MVTKIDFQHGWPQSLAETGFNNLQRSISLVLNQKDDLFFTTLCFNLPQRLTIHAIMHISSAHRLVEGYLSQG
jgi:hypothetical protein